MCSDESLAGLTPKVKDVRLHVLPRKWWPFRKVDKLLNSSARWHGIGPTVLCYHLFDNWLSLNPLKYLVPTLYDIMITHNISQESKNMMLSKKESKKMRSLMLLFVSSVFVSFMSRFSALDTLTPQELIRDGDKLV